MEHSKIDNYVIHSGTQPLLIIVTAIRMANDMDGNPRYKAQVWSSHNTIWSPKVKGFRRSKDDTYILKSVYNLDESMKQFVKVFEESINE